MKKTHLTIIILTLLALPILACDMFMLQSIDNYPFLTLPSSSGDFDDPYDFFENFKSQANQSSGNRDGYGVLAYKRDNLIIDRDYMWYKTGLGNYFNELDLNEPLYEAISVLYGNPDISRVLTHARSGTGGNGNHPFIFNANNRTYTFMHNGYIFNSVKSELINYLGQEWFLEHPSQWEGDFSHSSSFIDSEVIFHYLMYYILQYPDDIPSAFRYAFNNKRVGNIDMEYILKFNNSSIVNFIFSDGISTFAYRSSRIIGTSYNLSYQVYPNHFVAVKTGENLNNTIDRNQLLEFTPFGEVLTHNIEPILKTIFIKKFVETLDANQYILNWTIQTDEQITKFNIYRGLNQNFTNARQISSVLVANNNQTQFQYFDTYASYPEHYYWIEVVYADDSSEITSNIPSSQNDNEPDIPAITDNISLYPNPFKEKLNISIDSDQNYLVKVYNLKGQLVDQLTYNSISDSSLLWDSSINKNVKLSNGIYIIKFISSGKTFTKKVMRIK